MNKLTRDIAGTISTRFISLFILIISGIVVSRGLQPSGKGIYASTTTFVDMVTSFGALGIGKSALYYVAKKRFETGKVFQTVVSFSVINGSFIAFLSFALATSLKIESILILSKSGLVIVSALSFATIVSSYLDGLLRGSQHIRRCNEAQLLQSISFFVILLVVFFTYRLTPLTVLSIYLASDVISTCILVKSILSLGNWGHFGIDYKLLREMIVYGGSYQAYALIQLLHYKSDIFIIDHYLSSFSVGIYSNSVAISTLISNIPLSIIMVLTPWVANSKQKDAYQMTARISSIVFFAMLVLGTFIWIFSPTAILIMYGASYSPSIAPLRVLIPGIIANGILLTLSSYLVGSGKLMTLIMLASAACICNILLNIVLVPSWGVIGAAVASSSTYTLVAIGGIYLFLKEHSSSIRILIPNSGDIGLLFSVLMQFAKRRKSGSDIKNAKRIG